ncbi:MAG TPA: hypothetical protein VFZ66_25740 [Herpetosiphonaceae bacterium]
MNTDSFTGSLTRDALDRRAAAARRGWTWQPDLLSVALIAAWVLLALALVYRLPQTLRVDLGTTYARAYLRGFNQPEKNADYNYAFSGARAQIFLGGAGSGVFATTLRFDGVRPAEADPARVFFGAPQTPVGFKPSNGLRSYHVLVPSTSGDLDARIVANPFQPSERDPRQLGIPVDTFAVRSLTPGLPLRAAAMILAISLGLYGLARRLALRPDVSALLALLIVSSAIYGLFTNRLLITIGLVYWLAIVLGLHVALWPLRRVARAIYDRADVPLAADEERWLWRIFVAATLVKLGGMLYPHVIIFDEAAHVLRMNWLLEGRFMELYRPGYTSYMGDTVGLGGGQFPYSPLWYLVVVPFSFLGLGLPDATNGLSALMDVSKLFPIHLIARVTTSSRRTALYAAALYNLLPMPYFLLSWGNYPTQFGLWAALLATAFLAVHYQRFAQHTISWRTFGIWVALLALAILSYTVLGVFSVTLFMMIGIFGLFQRGGLGRKRLRFIVTGLLAAELLCFAIYHVQFAEAIVMDTLPAIVSGTADRADNPLDAAAEARENPLANFAANNQFTVGHFTPLLLVLTGLGGLGLAQQAHTRRWWPIWGAWLGIFVLYSLVSAFVADMVLKHVFFMMPLVAIWSGYVLSRWWRRGWAGRAAVLMVLCFLAFEVAQRGHFYLLIKRHTPL